MIGGVKYFQVYSKVDVRGKNTVSFAPKGFTPLGDIIS